MPTISFYACFRPSHDIFFKRSNVVWNLNSRKNDVCLQGPYNSLKSGNNDVQSRTNYIFNVMALSTACS